MKFSIAQRLAIALIGLGSLCLFKRSYDVYSDRPRTEAFQLTTADRVFFVRFNEYVRELSRQEDAPTSLAGQWCDLVGLWEESSRLVTFHDLLKVLPPPKAWPTLQRLLNSDTPEGNPRLPGKTQAVLSIVAAMLGHDDLAGSRNFDRLLALYSAENKPVPGPQINQLLRLFECVRNGTSDKDESRKQLDSLLHLLDQSGYSGTRPLRQLYVPNLDVLGDSVLSQTYAARMIRQPTQTFLVTANRQTQQWLRLETERNITQMSSLPDAWYRDDENSWADYAAVGKKYLASHWNRVNYDAFSLLWLQCLRHGWTSGKPENDWYLQQTYLFGTPWDNSQDRAFKYGLASPAYDFMADYLKFSQLAWSARRAALFAQMSGRSDDFSSLVLNHFSQRADVVDALVSLQLCVGKYDTAKPELIQNLKHLTERSSYALSLPESRRQYFSVFETDEFLTAGDLLGRSDWTAEGIKWAETVFASILNNRVLILEEKQGSCAVILNALLNAGLDFEASRLFQSFEASKLPLSNPLVDEQFRLATHLRQWSKIVSLAKQNPAWWNGASGVAADSGQVDSELISPFTVMAKACLETGDTAEAVRLLTLRLKSGPITVPLLQTSLQVLGEKTCQMALEESSAPEEEKSLARAILNPERCEAKAFVLPHDFSDLTRRRIRLRIEALSCLAQAARIRGDNEKAVQWWAAADDWLRVDRAFSLFHAHLDNEALLVGQQAEGLLSQSPMLNYFFAFQLERNGRANEAASRYGETFAALVAPQGPDGTQPNIEWLARLPFFSAVAQAEISRLCATKLVSSRSVPALCLGAMSEYQAGDDHQAFEHFSDVLRLDPTNRIACHHILKLSERIPISPALSQSAMETLLRQYRQVEFEPNQAYDLTKLWIASAAGAQKPPEQAWIDWFNWAYGAPPEDGLGADFLIDNADFKQALETLSHGDYPRVMSAVADTAGLTRCADLLDNL